MNTQTHVTEENTGPHHIEMGDWISCAPFEKLLNINILEANEGSATLTMPFRYDYAQGAGLMHGGALVSLADTAMVMAMKSILPPYSHFATILLETWFLKGVTQGTVTAKAKITGSEDRTFHGRADLFNENNEKVISFIATFKVARNTQIRGASFTPDSNE